MNIGDYIRETSAISPEDAEFMYGKIKDMKGTSLLEIGTGYGHSTVFFSKAQPDWTIYTLDGYGEYGSVPQFFNVRQKFEFNPQGIEGTRKYIQAYDCENVIMMVGDSMTILWQYPIDVLFIDGDHTLNGIRSDWNRFSKFVNKGGWVFIHDYNFVNGRNDNQVTEYIDEYIKPNYKTEVGGHTIGVQL